MGALYALAFLIFHSFASNLNRNSFNFSTSNSQTFHDSNLDGIIPNLLSLSPKDDFICDVNNQNLQIESKNFENTFAIKTEVGCNSITIISCTFKNIVIQGNSQSTTQMSIIYIKSAENFNITDCNFFDCDSNPVIYARSTNYFAENCIISYSSNSANNVGMQIDQSLNAEITQSIFTNTGKSAIDSSYNLNQSSLTISSCTISGCKINNNAVSTSNKVINFINNSITNEAESQGSRGLFINSLAQINIDQCTFTNCYNSDTQYGGAITCLKTNTNPLESYSISNCEFVGCEENCGAIYVCARLEVPKLTNIIISNAVCSYSISINLPDEPDIPTSYPRGTCEFQNVSFINITNTATAGGGIGLWYQITNDINPSDYSLSFNDCYFYNTRWTNPSPDSSRPYGGGAISIESSNCRTFHVSIDYCSFYHCSTESSHGAAIAVVSDKRIFINNIYIENCSAIGSASITDGGVIYAVQNGDMYDFTYFNVTLNNTISNSLNCVYFYGKNGGRYSVSRCKFINCLKETSDESSLIIANHNSLQFSCDDTVFSYDELSNSNSRAVDLHTPVFRFYFCSFTRCGKSDIYGGSIFYNDYACAEDDESIEITYCTFTECTSNNCGAFRLQIYNALPTIFNNTYKNIESHYILALIFTENVQFSVINFERQHFINCVNLKTDGGGSGIWISNHRADGNIYPTTVYFSECDFINCVSKASGGGGFGIGNAINIQPTELTFSECNFTGNRCESGEGGGALWIRTSITCSVSSCYFKDNQAGNKDSTGMNGGAICIRLVNSIPIFYISDSIFINNSCPGQNGYGHAIFGTYLFASLTIDQCDFIDNGYNIETPNSIIYTNSKLKITTAQFAFTDKKYSFSRGISIGSSADLELDDCDFYNCTDPTKLGSAIHYEVTPPRENQNIELYDCTFENNTDGSDCPVVYFFLHFPPFINDCTFQNEKTSADLIVFKFDEASNTYGLLNWTSFSRAIFINCDLDKHSCFNFIDNNNDDIQIYDITFEQLRFVSCSNFYILKPDAYELYMNSITFIDNVNDNYAFSIGARELIKIQMCVFSGNKGILPDGSDQKETATIFIKETKNCQITSTTFTNENNNDYGKEFKSSVLQIGGNVHLTEVSFIDCSTCRYSLFLEAKDNESSFSMADSFVNNSGSISLETQINQIQVSNTIFSYSHNGLIYVPNLDDTVDDTPGSVRIFGNTFDTFTNYALHIFVFDDIDFQSNTIKNCQRNEEDCSPIFELDFKNNASNCIIFEQFVFENNAFNNENNNSLINGGGIGLSITFPQTEDTINEDIFIDFIECSFISNNAVKCGGAFAYIEGQYASNSNILASFSFKSCTFKDNSCNRLKGHALYLEANNVTIENCIFESHNLLSDSLISNRDFTELSPEEIRECSVIYISSVKNEVISIVNNTFVNNKANSLFITNCEKDVFISDCLFKSNEIASFNESAQNDSFSLDNDIMSSCIVTILGLKESVKIQNCIFEGNSQSSENNKDGSSEKRIVRSGSIFTDTQNSFSMKNVSFYDNNVNDLILKALFDVSINDCQFISSKKDTSIAGCAMIIESKKTVAIQNCDISGYSSLNIEPSRILTPIKIQCEELCKLKLIKVKDVSGDVINATSSGNIDISNCTLESSSGISKNAKSSEINEFFIHCNCQKTFSMDFVSVNNHKSAISINRNVNVLKITNTQITNCQTGIVYQPDSTPSNSGSLTVERCTFSELEHAILLRETKPKVTFEKVAFYKCTNIDNDANKDPIIGIKLSSTTTTTLTLNKVIFRENKYSQSSSQNAAGGTGLLISGGKASTNVEFKECIFTLNNATNYNGGAFCLDSSSLSIKSLSFVSCGFSLNHAAKNSGALFIKLSDCPLVELIDCLFEMNEASCNYGAVSIESNGKLTIKSCNFNNNSATLTETIPRTDSLYVSVNSQAEIRSTNFTKGSFLNEETGYQATFNNNIQNGKEVFLIDSCMFSIINPSVPQVYLIVSNSQATTTITKSSFTHFFASDEENDHSLFLAASKFIKDVTLPVYYHLACNSVGSIQVTGCCFDTNSSHVVTQNNLGRRRRSAQITETEIIEGTTFIDSQFEDRKKVCAYPSVIDELIKQIGEPISEIDPEKEEKEKKKKLMIYIISAVVAFVVIVAVIIIVVIFVRKKRNSLKKTIDYNDDCQNQLEQEQYDMINTKYGGEMFNQKGVQYKSNNVASLSDSEKNCEESVIDEFDL